MFKKFSNVVISGVLFLGAAFAGETVIYQFTGGTDGQFPNSSLVSDGSGHLFGVTQYGGANNAGAVIELSHDTGSWVETVLYSFGGGTDGSTLFGPLAIDSSGNLYGVTTTGGNAAFCQSSSGCGQVYKLSLVFGTWTKTLLYGFRGSNDGAYPQAGLFINSTGALFGTTTNGGGSCDCGTVYSVYLSGGTWHEQVLYSFTNGSDSAYPWSTLVTDGNNNLYGTAQGLNCFCPVPLGSVFKLNLSAGVWTFSTVHVFGGGTDGATPIAQQIQIDGSGNLYGTTGFGGNNGAGVVWKLSPTYVESILYTFDPIHGDGSNPYGSVFLTPAGALYGTTASGGANGRGTIYKLTPTGGSWPETLLYSFAGGSDGDFPKGGLTYMGGSFYAPTFKGGGSIACTDGCGTVIRYAP